MRPHACLLILLAGACMPMSAPGHAHAEGEMFDPAIDRPDREWCYAAHSTTVIGLPFAPEPVQVTYDGAVYTRSAELAFFFGKDLTPVMARNKTFLDGWIPVVGYRWRDAGIEYRLELFSSELGGLGRANLVQFARLGMSNLGPRPAEGVLAAGVRGSAGHFRLGGVRRPVTPNTEFRFQDNSLRRDGELVYTFSGQPELCAVPGTACAGAYRAMDHHVTDRSATGLAIYRRTLQPGESFAAFFAMPRVPTGDAKAIAALSSADYQDQRDRTVAFWMDLLGCVEFRIPEKRVQDSYRAALVHLILATRDTGQKRQGSGLPYDDLFLNDYMDMLLAYLTSGLWKLAEPNVDWLMRKQHPSGMFLDVHNRGNTDIVTSHGQGLFALAYPVVMNRDLAYGRRVYPAIRKGAEFIVRDHKTHNRHGLLRPSIPYDAPMVTGYHTCHNLFALAALRASIRAARLLGEKADADAWTAAEATYRQAILKAIDDVHRKEGYIRSGLYDWSAGWVQGRKGWVNDHPNQDWENNLLVYPTELLEAGDPRLAATLAAIRSRKYREGVMTYRNGMHVHQYVTLNQAQQYRAIGDQKHALLDLYHVLLHNGSTHEGFENLVVPWSTRTPAASCPPPHAWAAAKTALFIRNMMVCEQGGQAGLEEARRDLHLYSLISPAWIQPGRQVAVRNAPTEMGEISSTLTFTDAGAELAVQASFHTPPQHVVFRVPYSVELQSFTSDAARSSAKDGQLLFSPDVTKASIRWRPRAGAHDRNYRDILAGYRGEYGHVRDGNYSAAKPGETFLLADEKDHAPEPLSFDLVRRAFLAEYSRRFAEYRKAGGKPHPVEPPPLLTAQQRREAFERQFGQIDPSTWTPKKIGIACGKPATASASLGDHPPRLAVDGVADNLLSSWQTDPYPAWLKIDLEQAVRIDRVHVFPYWGGGRYYRYTVEVSADGKEWRRVADLSDNRKPATGEGDLHKFEAVQARYVRVNMLYHSLNRGVHLVEVRVFEAAGN